MPHLVSADFHHVPVLLEESAEYLHLKPGAVILDGTLGGGGHAEAILERITPDGVLVGLDLDEQALAASTSRLARFGDRVRTVQSSFRHLDTALGELGIERVDGVLLDLGVSSYQLDAPDRGFRFGDSAASETPLDMRMDPSRGASAAELLHRASAEELQGWFQRYGELPGSRRLARAITQRRGRQPLRTTADLLEVIEEAGVGGGRRHNPATLVFQALRIAVNDELGALEDGLGAAVSILRPGGRLVVISYHSLEDRIVKHNFRSAARGCICPPKQPICNCEQLPSLEVLTRRPLRPETTETDRNPRARSARLRAAKRIAEAA
jgi:16S rRNA (cytosine1402-N4)-methyltransferase